MTAATLKGNLMKRTILMLLVLFPAICHAQTNLGGAGGGGGGISSVTSLPATCTPGQSFILPTGAFVPCSSTANVFASGRANIIDPLTFGISFDGKACYGTNVSWTTGNPSTVTLDGVNCKFSAVEIGTSTKKAQG